MDEILVKYSADTKQYSEQLKGLEQDNKNLEKSAADASKAIVAGATQAGTGMKTFRQQIKEATVAYQEAVAKTGEFSKAALDAQKNVAHLKDEFGDFQRRTEAFNPDQKFKVLGQAIGLAASGFQGIVAAQALFGNQSKDLEKVLIKVQAAMALTQAINSLGELGDVLKNVKSVIIGQLIPALGTLRGALIATGIGAAAVVVGLLVANWDKVVSAVRTFIGLGPSAETVLENETKAHEKLNDEIERGIRLQDSATSTLKGREREVTEISNATTKKILDAQKFQNEESDKLRKQFIDGQISTQEELDSKLEQLNKDRIFIQQNANTEGENKIADIKSKFAKEDKDKRDKEIEANKGLVEKRIAVVKKELQAELDATRANNEGLKKLNKDKEDAQYQAFKDSTDILQKEFDIKQKQAQAEIDLEYQKSQARLEGFAIASNILGSISALVGAQTEAGKELAVAETIISTYVAAQKAYEAYAAFPPLAIAAAAAAVLAGLARVSQIEAVTIPQSNSAGSQQIQQIQPRLAAGAIDLMGPGTGTSDSISAKLSRGESVITAKATRAKKDELIALNYGVLNYNQLIEEKYIAPAIEAEKRKQNAFTNSIVHAMSLTMPDKNIIKAIKSNKPATRDDIRGIADAVERSSREARFLNRHSL